METRRENRPVSRIVASGLFMPGMRLSVARAPKPSARDPPCRAVRVTTLPAGLRAGVPRQTPGRPPHTRGQKRREAMQEHRLSRTPDQQS